MDAYNGDYYIEGSGPQPATVLLLRDKISIGLTDENGNPRIVYWQYQHIIRENYRQGDKIVVRYEGYPRQLLEIGTDEFLQKLEAIFAYREKSWIRRAFSANVMGLVKMFIVIIAVLVAGYFWLIPFLAERMAKRVPVSYEKKLGDGLFEALQSGFEMDEKKTLLINDFFNELKIPSDYTIQITVVKENVANAFALPGGHIVVYDRLIREMNSYEELAALLSHEFTHVQNKHATRSIFRSLGSAVFLSVVFGDLGSISNVVIRQADNLKSLNYSRRLEKEADLNGLKILTERKIDGNGFVKLFELLKREVNASGGGMPVEWISSHPDLDKRINYISTNELFNQQGIEINETLGILFLKMKKGADQPREITTGF